MTTNYILADLITKINVGSRSHIRSIKLNYSRKAVQILSILYQNGIIAKFSVDMNTNKISIFFRYVNRKPVFQCLKLVSKPSKRIYWSLTNLNLRASSGEFTGFYIISTSKGLLTSHDCLLIHHISGEVLLKIEI